MLEADGTITLLGRGSGCINTGGEKVFPEEVEGVLKGHPAVYDALVVGVPDERWGNAVAAVVQVREGQDAPTLDEVAEHCRSHIAAYKVPGTCCWCPRSSAHRAASPTTRGPAGRRWPSSASPESSGESAGTAVARPFGETLTRGVGPGHLGWLHASSLDRSVGRG